jgi:4-amino-4-deoxy-L-arabinose transferase-like glycosyltransferase
VGRPTTRDLGALGAVAALAAVARILYWALVTPDYVPLTDADHYRELAENLANGVGFEARYPQLYAHPTAFRPPGYPFVLSLAYRVFGDDVVVGRVLNLVIGVGVVALVFLLARRLGGLRAGVVTGTVTALYPPIIANDTVLLTEPMSLALLAGLLLALSHRRWAIAALLCGLLVLTRPSAQFLVPVVALWVLWQLGWRRAVGVVGIAVVVVAPWVVRNWVQLGQPVLVTSNGFNLFALYSEEAQADRDFVDPVFDPRFERYWLTAFDEAAWQRALQDDALDALRDNPDYVLRVVGRHSLMYFELTPSENDGAERVDGRNLDFRTWTLPAFWLVTGVGLAGLAARWREPVVLLMLVLIVYFVGSNLVFVFAPRLRAPFDLFCCVGVGLAWARWVPRRRAREPDEEGSGEPEGPAEVSAAAR